MKMLFTDLRRSSGTTIISSAGGKEHAFESKNIKNGVFTYSLINGLNSKDADKNNDGKITPDEFPRGQEQFDRLDKDGNGVLTEDELFAGFRAMRRRRQ